MTLPDERYRAIVKARDFLRELMDPKKTPRIPKAIRHRAYWCLRHFPWEMHLEELAEKCPTILEAPYEDIISES